LPNDCKEINFFPSVKQTGFPYEQEKLLLQISEPCSHNWEFWKWLF